MEDLKSLMQPIAEKFGKVTFLMALDFVNLNRAICQGMEGMPDEAHERMHESIEYAWTLVAAQHEVPFETFVDASQTVQRAYDTIDMIVGLEHDDHSKVPLPPCAFGRK